MNVLLRRSLAAWVLWAGVSHGLHAQELEPGAYSPAPVGMNILVLADTFSTGDLNFDPSGPIDEASADINNTIAGYVRTFGFAGRAASLGVALPYVRGDLEGLVSGEPQSAHRSGWGDPRVRLAVNLHGVPALAPKEFAAHQHPWTLGASLTLGLPLGQYHPDKLVNIGANRWAAKPELGVTRTVGRWTVEAAAGAWLFTDNTDYYIGRTREQDPIGSLQVHVIHTFRPRLWIAVDANFYNGGRTTIDGVRSDDLQSNSRIGCTFSLPLDRQHSLKFAYSRGAITRIGADFDSIGVSYQYVWGSAR
ncbi:MAG: transporter [Opitutaceae bacterium]|nr:transporter [Opitutaceae bacterium]